jgi:tetratricopeptide (TPR) repeat protein
MIFKKGFSILFFGFFFYVTIAQNAQLANAYLRNGEYEKAILLYKPLHEQNPVRQDYFKSLLICYQQIDDYEMAEEMIQRNMKLFPNQVYLNVELGYNYQLQDVFDKAKIYYEKAIDVVKKNPGFGFIIGQTFRKNHLLDYALQSYQIAKELNPKLNTEIYEAQIYGEKGALDKMFNAYLDLIDKNEKYYPTIQRYIAVFITDDKNDKTNILFKKLLLKRAQNNPKDAWNILLSWLYLQQKEYGKALVQEKSLFKRNPDDLKRIVEVGILSFENKDYETSQKSFDLIVENTNDSKTKLQAQTYLLQISNELASTKNELNEVDKKFQKLLDQYGYSGSTINLQIAYAHFLSYSFNQSEKAMKVLNKALPLAKSKFQKGQIQIELADILVITNQFNQALILYSQVQTNLKSSVIAQEARFKIAQTSYFKGDFQWAQTQLKVLKSSTSQLIANDALELSLLIGNNTAKDSIQDALKMYAKADLLAYQNKYIQAIDTLNVVLQNFKGHAIEDDALYKQAALFVKTKNYTRAESNYLRIIKNIPESLLTDDTYFRLATLYNKQLNNPEKAKEMYQKIIFEFPSSIYLVDARKKYRKLRGDDIQ